MTAYDDLRDGLLAALDDTDAQWAAHWITGDGRETVLAALSLAAFSSNAPRPPVSCPGTGQNASSS